MKYLMASLHAQTIHYKFTTTATASSNTVVIASEEYER